MNDEIKEILEDWKIGIETGEDKYGIKVDGIGYNWRELKVLLDYITNLQEENDNLKNIISSVKEDFLNANNELTNLQQENERLKEKINEVVNKQQLIEEKFNYKSRIEKAVEYIKADYINGLVDGLSWLEVQELVKILNGRSDE